MATDKRQYTLRLKEENFQKIRYLATRDCRSLAAEIEYLILQYITEYEKEYGEIPVSEED